MNCKTKIQNDGLQTTKEYLPVFDFENNCFISYGLFDENNLPIKVSKQTSDFYPNRIAYSIDIDNNNIDNPKKYTYSSEQLAKYGLYDILNRFNKDTVELKDLKNCNNVEVFKSTITSMQNKKYTRKNLFGQGLDITKEYIQDQLNEVLENLNPNLSKFWEIIVFLIDSGAYYTKQEGYGSDVTCFNKIKDFSKTNIIYRIAKDKISK